jgi:hypothetical protein
MTNFFLKLLGIKSKPSTKNVDWLHVEGKLRELEQMSKLTDQSSAKQLIIQGDVLVDSILKDAKVAGQTMGERLRNLKERLPRTEYNNLWQAHNKRNELVHEANSFVADWEKNKYFESFKSGIGALRGMR